MIPLLRTVGKNTPWGPLERTNELSVLYGMQQRFGCHSHFITFSQSSSSQSLVVTLGSRKFKSNDNGSHPAEFENGKVIWDSKDCNRMSTAIHSPATCAAYFDSVCKAVLTCLLGLDLDTKKEVIIMDKTPGIFGEVLKARACHAVTEAQARGALHLHILYWLMYGPLWFSRFVHDDKFCDKLKKYISQCVTASISEAEHSLREQPRKYEYPKVISNISELKKRGREVASHTQHHKHTARCRKLPGGKDKCDLGRPCVQSSEIVFDQIKLEDPVQEDNSVKKLKDCSVVQIKPIEMPPPIQPTEKLKPLPEQDERVIAVTLKRCTIKDKAMTEFNEILSGCLLCNICNTPVGCGQDAKATVFYNCTYCTKNPCKLTECLPLLQVARRNAQQYPSVADNPNIDMNVAKYTLSKVLNQTSKLCEYSLEQSCAGLLNMKSSYKTCTTTYLYVRKAMSKLNECVQDQSKDCNFDEESENELESSEINDEENTSLDDDTESSSVTEYEETSVTDNDENVLVDKEKENISLGECENSRSFLDTLKNTVACSNTNDDGEFHDIGATLYTTSNDKSNEDSMDFSDEKADGKVDIVQDENESITFVHQHDDYNYRPTSLYFLNYLEFFCLFQRVSKEKDKKEKKNRRKCNLVLNFQDKHPMSETKCLKLRSLHFTPILAGQPRPPWSSFKNKKKLHTILCNTFYSLGL